MTEQQYRSACDVCHTRKIRCTNDSQGACVTCQRTGRPCVYSPRDEMGRPRKSSSRIKNKRGKPPRASSDSELLHMKTASSTPRASPPRDDPPHHSPAVSALQEGSNEETCQQSTSKGFMMDGSYGALPMHCQFPPMSAMNDPEQFFPLDDVNCFDLVPMGDSHFDPMNLNSQPPFSNLPTPPNHESDFIPHFASSMHSTAPTMNAAAQMPLGQDSDVVAISRQMTAILFQLRAKRNFRWSMCDDGLAAQSMVLQTVTELCRLIQTALQSQHVMSDLQQIHEYEKTTLYILTATTVSTIVDIYHSIGRCYTLEPDQNTAPSPERCNTPASQRYGSSRDFSGLAKIIHLDTMDFHLSSLRDALDVIQSRDLQMDIVDDTCNADIQHLRTTLQATASGLRCC